MAWLHCTSILRDQEQLAQPHLALCKHLSLKSSKCSANWGSYPSRTITPTSASLLQRVLKGVFHPTLKKPVASPEAFEALCCDNEASESKQAPHVVPPTGTTCQVRAVASEAHHCGTWWCLAKMDALWYSWWPPYRVAQKGKWDAVSALNDTCTDLKFNGTYIIIYIMFTSESFTTHSHGTSPPRGCPIIGPRSWAWWEVRVELS